MTKAIIFKCNNDHKNKYTIYFCVDNNFYMHTILGNVELKNALLSCKQNMTLIKRMPKMLERMELMEKMVALNYKDAANYYFDYQKSKGREGKLFQGEYNDK